MTEEQKKKCEEIINSYEEKYNKDFEEALTNISNAPEILNVTINDVKEIKNYIPMLLFWYDKSDLKWNIVSPLHLEPTPQDKARAKFLELLAKTKDKTVENIIDLTIDLSEVFGNGITKEEAKKLLFNKKATKMDGTFSYLNIFTEATEEFIKIMKNYEKGYFEYENYEEEICSIKNIGEAIANYFEKEKIMPNNDELTLNLLILGQTGVGKSSLVNALVGREVEKTSAGRPQTEKERKNESGEIERGIYPHPHEIDGKKVVIYDSWGLEVDKATEWEDIIEEELKKRSDDKDIKDWFHSVTYCIQAGGYKIQDFDIKMIKLFMDKKYNVIVALTKSDQIGKEKREKFIKEIEKAIKIKIITYRALIKSNLINEVKKEFIKEIEKEIGEIEFEQIEETKSDMYPIAARVPIFITAIPPINLKYDNIVKGLMKSNQIEQSKIEKFIKEIVKEIKETTKIGITVIPISANPEQLDNMTEKPKPYGLEEYKAAILLSWEKIFIDRIPLHIIEKLKKDIENAKYNAPNRKPKNDDDLKILAKEIQEYFNNVLKENLQSRIKENFEKYYKITEDIININTNIDISNFYSRKNIDPDTYLYDYIGFSISHLFEHIKDLFKYLYNRMKIKENIEEFINKTYKETKEYISKKEFEDNIRKSIIDIFNKIENKKN